MLETAAGTEMLVDGQQRVTTLHQYFTASTAIKLSDGINPYRNLSEDEQKEFIDYLERLRRAKDKTEFDQFMADRRRPTIVPDQTPNA